MKITKKNYILQLKTGNEEALEYVIDNYGWVLKTVIKKHLFYLPDYYGECMNDCLMGIWENIGNYKAEISDFKNWIAGVAKYKSLNYVRKYLKDLENKNIEDVVITEEDMVLKELLHKEFHQEIKKMLCNLSEEDQRIFIKLYFEEKDMDRISREVGLSKPVLYNRLSRGRKRIREVVNTKGGSQ